MFLVVHNKLITMGSIQGMMAYFSVSCPKMLFYIENTGRDSVPLPIIIFYYGDRRGKLCLTGNDNLLLWVQEKK